MKRGFTLVELSIVLVIIGLLTGGVLAGRSMIKAVKISGTASQIQEFDAAVMVYKAKYRALPGDALRAGGDGDGLIERTANPSPANSNNAVNVFQCEIANFWHDLYPEKYAGGPCAPNDNSNPPMIYKKGPSTNVVRSKMGSKDSFFIASALATAAPYYVNLNDQRNYYAITVSTGTNGVFNGQMTYGVKSSELAALDGKIDDGIPDSGDVLSASMNNGLNASSYIHSDCSTGAVYNSAATIAGCVPAIRMGASSGSRL